MHESGGKLISTFSNHSEMEVPDPWKFCDNTGAFEIPDPWKFWREPKSPKQNKKRFLLVSEVHILSSLTCLLLRKMSIIFLMIGVLPRSYGNNRKMFLSKTLQTSHIISLYVFIKY